MVVCLFIPVLGIFLRNLCNSYFSTHLFKFMSICVIHRFKIRIHKDKHMLFPFPDTLQMPGCIMSVYAIRLHTAVSAWLQQHLVHLRH